MYASSVFFQFDTSNLGAHKYLALLNQLHKSKKIKLRAYFVKIQLVWEYVAYKQAHITPDPTLGPSEWMLLPAFSANYKAFYKSPKFQVLQTYFIDVFTYDLWAFWIGFALLIGLLSALFSIFVINEDPVLSIFMVTFVLSGQDIFIRSNKISWRIFAVAVGFLSFVLMCAFDIFLTTYLSLQSADLPIQRMDDIIKTNYSICVNPQSEVTRHLLNSKWDSHINNGACPNESIWKLLMTPISHTCDTSNIVSILKYLKKGFELPFAIIFRNTI